MITDKAFWRIHDQLLFFIYKLRISLDLGQMIDALSKAPGFSVSYFWNRYLGRSYPYRIDHYHISQKAMGEYCQKAENDIRLAYTLSNLLDQHQKLIPPQCLKNVIINARKDPSLSRMVLIRVAVKQHPELFTSDDLPAIIKAAKREPNIAPWLLLRLASERSEMFTQAHLPGMVEAAKKQTLAAWALAELSLKRPELVSTVSSITMSQLIKSIKNSMSKYDQISSIAAVIVAFPDISKKLLTKLIDMQTRIKREPLLGIRYIASKRPELFTQHDISKILDLIKTPPFANRQYYIQDFIQALKYLVISRANMFTGQIVDELLAMTKKQSGPSSHIIHGLTGTWPSASSDLILELIERRPSVFTRHHLDIILSRAYSYPYGMILFELSKRRLDLFNGKDIPLIRKVLEKAKGNYSVRFVKKALHLVRIRAVKVLDNTDSNSVSAISAYIKLLKDEDKYVRSAAAEALGRIGPKAATAISALIKLLEDKEVSVRKHVAEALGNIGPKANAAIPALIKLLRSRESEVRFSTATALRKMGPHAATAVPALIKLLENEDKYARLGAAEALWRMGRKAIPAVPALIRLLEDKEVFVRELAVRALGNTGSEVASTIIPALIKCLEDKEASVRESAARALGNMGPKAARAIPALTKCLEDMETSVRESVAWALGYIGPTATAAIPALAKLLDDKETSLRKGAVWALGSIGPKASAAVPALIESLKDRAWDVRFRAAEALGKIGSQAATAVPVLIKLLRDRNETVRAYTAEALGRIGPKAASAIHALTERLKDMKTSVRFSAERALKKIKQREIKKTKNPSSN